MQAKRGEGCLKIQKIFTVFEVSNDSKFLQIKIFKKEGDKHAKEIQRLEAEKDKRGKEVLQANAMLRHLATCCMSPRTPVSPPKTAPRPPRPNQCPPTLTGAF